MTYLEFYVLPLIFLHITFSNLVLGEQIVPQLWYLNCLINMIETGYMENILTDYLRGQLFPTDLTINYHIGNAFSGETDLRLRGDGIYELWSTVTQDRQHRRYSGQLNVADVHELVQTIQSVRLWEVQHIFMEGGRDNPEARIVVTANEESFTVVLWVMEIEDVPAFDEVQEKILTLVRRVSDGEVLEVGR